MIDQNADQTKFLSVRDEFNNYQNYLYGEYIKYISAHTKHNTKKFLQYINGKRKTNLLPCKIEFKGQTATNDLDKVMLFAQFFSSIYTDHGDDMELSQFIDNRNDSNTFNLTISQDEICFALKRMNLNKGSGQDEIPPLFMGECVDALAIPLFAIFSTSLSTDVYPGGWKLGQLYPSRK